jgi:hypothetical protein
MTRGSLVRRALGAAVIRLLLGAAAATGQVAFDSPRMLGPHAPAGFGMYWLRSSAFPDDGDGLLITWAPLPLEGKLVLRGGAGTGLRGTPAGFAGVDTRVPIATGPGRLLDVSWNAGLGASFGEYLMGTLPMGISVGREWSAGAVAFAPYVSGGIALDMRFFQDERDPQEEFSVQHSIGLGTDLSLDAGRRVTLRAGVSLGERGAAAVGVMLQSRPR